MKVLFLIARSDPCGAATQLRLLAAGLPRERFEARVCILGRSGPLTTALQADGVSVEALGWHRPLDVGAPLRLQRMIEAFRPDAVHVWQPAALRISALLPGLRKARVFVSCLFEPRESGVEIAALDRWLVRRVERVIVFAPSEERWCREAGIAEERIARVPPAVAAAPNVVATGLPERYIACVGPLHPHKGFRDAIWAFDILRFVEANVHLIIVGEGPDGPRLETFARDCQSTGLVHLLGRRDDVPAVLAGAEIVWVPSRSAGGVNVALEAMAAGRPVIATRLPELAELIVDGESGILVPPGDKPALAGQTRKLLTDAEPRAQLGVAGRKRVVEHYSVTRMIEAICRVYETPGERGA